MPLTKIASRLTRMAMKSDRLWALASKLPNHEFFYRQRYSVIRKRARRECADVLDAGEVISGPFAGLKYAKEAAVGSSLWPKLLGTYESELRPCFDTIAKNRGYRQVVDVGFAEGFYLVGLGRMFESAELIGFDSEEEAKTLCQANADINGIDPSRLKLYGGFEASTFQDVLNEDSLVVVDCEGFENNVIESLNSDGLNKADWLIETHDHIVGGTTDRLRLAFASTHDIHEVETDADLENKLGLLPVQIRDRCSDYVCEALVSEGRLDSQTWIFATRRAA